MIIAVIVLAAVAAAFFVKIRLCAYTLRRGFFEIKIKFGIILIFYGVFYLRVRSEKMPRLYRITNSGRAEIDIYKMRSSMRKKNRQVAAIKSAVNLDAADLTAIIGTGDAASTALLCGAAGVLADVAQNILQNGHVKLHVKPDFSRAKLEVCGNCILSLSVADIIKNKRK